MEQKEKVTMWKKERKIEKIWIITVRKKDRDKEIRQRERDEKRERDKIQRKK